MKKTLKYILLFSVLAVCTILDSCVFKLFRATLIICVCFSFYSKNEKAVVIAGMTGLLCDVISFTLPTFSLIYLYISLGCVWCQELFLRIKVKSVILLSFLAFLGFFVLCQTINILVFNQFPFFLDIIFQAILFTGINSAFAPLVYFGFKRLKF